jgi:hypothetical protein
MRKLCAALMFVVLGFVGVHAAERAWQTGKLIEVEQEKVKEGSTKTTNTDAEVKNKGDKAKYSGNSTTTTSDNIDTYQVYTIQGGDKVFVAKEKLLFPWSKPQTDRLNSSSSMSS